jgi:hypothetical protein
MPLTESEARQIAEDQERGVRLSHEKLQSLTQAEISMIAKHLPRQTDPFVLVFGGQPHLCRNLQHCAEQAQEELADRLDRLADDIGHRRGHYRSLSVAPGLAAGIGSEGHKVAALAEPLAAALCSDWRDEQVAVLRSVAQAARKKAQQPIEGSTSIESLGVIHSIVGREVVFVPE